MSDTCRVLVLEEREVPSSVDPTLMLVEVVTVGLLHVPAKLVEWRGRGVFAHYAALRLPDGRVALHAEKHACKPTFDLVYCVPFVRDVSEGEIIPIP